MYKITKLLYIDTGFVGASYEKEVTLNVVEEATSSEIQAAFDEAALDFLLESTKCGHKEIV